MKITINKPKKVFLFILSILAVIIISSILAYLTDKASKENEFTIGSVDIELLEPIWDSLPDIDGNNIPDEAEALGPNQSIAKDPQVKNKGDNPAYVYLRVEVPKSVVKIDNEETAKNQEIFTYQVHTDNWQIMENLTIDDEDSDTVTYTYYYKNGAKDYLEVDELSNTLFDRVTLKNITDFNNMELSRQIVVKAYAIQLGDELTVEANPWITQFENEAIPLPKMMLASFASSPANSTVGYQPGESIVVSVPFTDEVSFDTAPEMTGKVGEGAPESLEFMPEETSKLNKTLALTSRADEKKMYTVLKYKYTVKSGDEGEFKIVSFIGTVYSKNNKEIKINVNNLPFTPGTEEIDVSEKLPIQGQAVITSTPESLEDGYQPDEEIIIEIPFDDEIYGTNTKGAITESNAPTLTAKVGDGTAKNLTYVPEETGKKLKYKYKVQDGDLGEFQITNITGNIYSKAGTLITLSLPTISDGGKIIIKEPVSVLLWNQIDETNYGQVLIKDFPEYEVFYKGSVRDSEIGVTSTESNKIVLIYNGDNGYFTNEQIPIEAKMTTIRNEVQKKYSAWWTTDVLTSPLYQESAIELVNDEAWTNKIIKNDRLKTKGIIATGGVGLTTWVASWNQKNSKTIYIRYTKNSQKGYENCSGWGISLNSDFSGTITHIYGLNTENTLYFPYQTVQDDPSNQTAEKCMGYKLASPSNNGGIQLMSVVCNGQVGNNAYNTYSFSMRPAIYLPNDIQVFWDSAKKMWKIK